MKFVLPVIFVLIALVTYAQPDSTHWDRTMEGVHKRSLCVVDTMVTLYSQKTLVIEDSVDWSYDFAEGEKTYLEVKIRTTVCSCMDCSYADHVVIDISTLKPGDEVELNPSNTVWFIWNSWMIGSIEQTFTGSLKYTAANDFLIEIYKYVPGQSWLTYDGIKVLRP
ncbi:MAG: hypothetical protein HYZ14_01555 [Bacteroidetes bacterium]|nr:hypothetical protein [Bacteroidota bacterium]